MPTIVAVAQDLAGRLKPAKDKSTERIDDTVALVMAIGRTMVAEAEPHCLLPAVLCLTRRIPPVCCPSTSSATSGPVRGTLQIQAARSTLTMIFGDIC
jgi:hypothetical protein